MHSTGPRLVVAAVALFGAVSGALAAPTPAAAAERSSFTLAVIPDTQLAVQNKPQLFYAQTRWIAEHQNARDIPFVVHEGDVVEWPSRRSDWERADTAMTTLDGKVPYSISVGNHDFDAWACEPAATCNPWQGIAEDRSTDNFNAYFPHSRFAGMPGFGGSYPEGRSDNTYFTFSAGGVDWLVLSLAFDPTDAELAWANTVATRHPDRQLVLNAHEYQNGDRRTAVGDRIWNAFARRHANVRIVLSGHYSNAGLRIDQGDHGNTVYGIQADYQTYSRTRVNENSYLRLMRFQPRAGTLIVKTYSPYCDQTGECPAFKTDPRNQFTLTGMEFPVGSTAQP